MTDWNMATDDLSGIATANADKFKIPPSERVSILVAAPPDKIAPLTKTFSADARFNLAAVATSAEDVRVKLAVRPEVVLAHADTATSLEEFSQVLGSFGGHLFTILPETVLPSVIAAVQGLPSSREVISGEPNLPELAGQIYLTVSAGRLISTNSPGFRLSQGPRSAMVGWRCIAVWSLQGGTGRSTIATALALEAAERRLPTLLVGLGAPDVIPLRLDFPGAEPNLLTWSEAPTPERLKVSVQQFDVLDVLSGFPDQSALDDYAPYALDADNGLPALAGSAAHAGYAVVVLDVSSAEMAAPAISAANTMLLTAIPTPDALLATGRASTMVGEMMSQQHNIPLEGIHLVLNRVRDTMLAPDEFMRSLGRMPDITPPLAAVIPDDPRIDVARTQFRPAYNFSEPLRQAMKHIGDILFAPPPGLAAVQKAQQGRPSRVWRIGPLRIKR